MCTCAWCNARVPASNTILMQMHTGLILPVCYDCSVKKSKGKKSAKK